MSDSKTYLSLAQIGSRLGLSKQGVQKAAIRNTLPKNEAGKYSLEDIATALKAEQSERLQSTKTSETNSVLKQKLMLIKIEKAELELNETKGRLVSFADARREWSKVINNAKAVLLALPGTSPLSGLTMGLDSRFGWTRRRNDYECIHFMVWPKKPRGC